MCFFKQKTAYEMRISDWSSDVCSSDLPGARPAVRGDRQRWFEARPWRRQPALGADGADALRRRRRSRAVSHDALSRKGFRRMTDVAGKTAFITGGASGLGFANAKALVAKGASVILADIDGAGAAAAAAMLPGDGANPIGLHP